MVLYFNQNEIHNLFITQRLTTNTSQFTCITSHLVINPMTAWKEYQKKVVTGQSIGKQLDQMGTEVICQNRKYTVALMECCILYCSQHGIAFRGQDQGNNALNPGNLKSLMMLISQHCQQVRDCLNTAAKVLHGFTKSSK